MIPAAKSAFVGRLLLADTLRRMRRRFEAVRVAGLAETRARLAAGPLLVVSNHTAWWDPLVALLVSAHLLGADGYALMDAKNLRKLPFFKGIGAFGVDLDDPADGARALRYAAKLLRERGRLVWIFPQGEERPITQRPLGFRPGSAEIGRLARRAAVLPVGIRYEHGNTERPRLYVSVGPPVPPGGDAETQRLAQEQAVLRELERIDEALVARDETGFETVLSGSRSRLFAALQRALAWFSGRR